MTLDEIKAEMARKPDAQLALEWIADSSTTHEDALEAAEAYFGAWDEED